MEVQVELDRETFRRLFRSALTERRSVGDQAERLLRDALQPPGRAAQRGLKGRPPAAAPGATRGR